MEIEQNAKSFFTRLEEALNRSRIGKGELASQLGVALSTLSRWRHARPREETLDRIASILDVSEEWLKKGTGPMFHMDASRRAETSSVLREDPTPYKTSMHESPTPHNENTVDQRLRVMISRVSEDAQAMIKASPKHREKLAESAKSHITHFLAWLGSSDSDDDCADD